MEKSYYVYILTNYNESLFYIGVTSNLEKRIYEHKNFSHDSFTAKYKINRLVHYEETNSIEQAILREKKLKNWHKQWKIDLIKKHNPTFIDLSSKW